MSDTLLTEKILIGENVLRAAIARIEWIFETFPSVCLSFSGGKDSTVLFHLVAEVARRRKRHFSVLFIDWEAQYQCTIAHILKMREMYRDVTAINAARMALRRTGAGAGTARICGNVMSFQAHKASNKQSVF